MLSSIQSSNDNGKTFLTNDSEKEQKILAQRQKRYEENHRLI